MLMHAVAQRCAPPATRDKLWHTENAAGCRHRRGGHPYRSAPQPTLRHNWDAIVCRSSGDYGIKWKRSAWHRLGVLETDRGRPAHRDAACRYADARRKFENHPPPARHYAALPIPMPLVYFVTHPDVSIDASVPVPQWRLSERGIERMHLFAKQPWLSNVGAIFCSAERKAIDGAIIWAMLFSAGMSCWKAWAKMIDRQPVIFQGLSLRKRRTNSLPGPTSVCAAGSEPTMHNGASSPHGGNSQRCKQRRRRHYCDIARRCRRTLFMPRQGHRHQPLRRPATRQRRQFSCA